MGFKVLTSLSFIILTLIGSTASARPYYYPQERYRNTFSESLGGITVPMTDEIGNSMMNNPAGLARFGGVRAEPLNINFGVSSGILSKQAYGATSLSGAQQYLDASQNKIFGLGGSNLTAFAWSGLAVGILMQEFSKATYDGTTVQREAVSQLIPTVAYGFGLARNIIRIGYSLQWVNEVSGSTSGTLAESKSYLQGLRKGMGFSHNASVNFVLPFHYLPTFSFMTRNIGGLHFLPGALLPRGTGVVGTPAYQPITVDFAFDFLVKLSAATQVHWYFQYRDIAGRMAAPGVIQKLALGMDLRLTRAFGIRAGLNGTLYSAGIGYKSTSTEINLAYHNEATPFNNVQRDTRYGLQYKIMLQEKIKKMDPGSGGPQ